MGQLSRALAGGSLWLSTGCPQGGIKGCAEWLLCDVSQYLCVPYLNIIFHSPASGSQLKICLSLQTFRDPSVTLLVCVWAAESLRHQRESQTRVHRICWGHDVWDLQRHLPGRAAEHAHSHDEQLLPAHCCELPLLFLLLFLPVCLICLTCSRWVPSGMLRLLPPVSACR